MQEDSIIEAKQARSQQTQKKLLAALSDSLKTQFFEHISIAHITEQAGVSVGTFYRRFKNKEALLPYLYQDFSEQFKDWVSALEENKQGSLNDQIALLVTECNAFLHTHAGVLRTLHLNSRLYPEILTKSQLFERSHDYQQLAALLMTYSTEIRHSKPKIACEMAIFMLISNLIEKVLYSELTPAIASPLSEEENQQELTLALQNYLQSPQA